MELSSQIKNGWTYDPTNQYGEQMGFFIPETKDKDISRE